MDTSSATRRGRNERVHGCAWARPDPGFRRRNRATVDENFEPGKNPCAQPPGFVHCDTLGAPIAQLDRASDYGSEGCRFNSYWVRHFKFLIFDLRFWIEGSVEFPTVSSRLRITCGVPVWIRLRAILPRG